MDISVEEALSELLEMRLDARIKMEVETPRSAQWSIFILGYIGHFHGFTLADCMAQVRAWHKEQQ